MKDIRIAAVCCRCPVGQIEYNLEQTIYWTQKALKKGADLVCFPELNITGYCTHEEMAAIALPGSSRLFEQLSNLAKETGLTILAGMAEHNPNGRPFASHCVIGPDGHRRMYRKLHLAPNEQPYFAPGDTIPVFDTQQTRFGVQLCYDGHFPELSTAMTAQGVHIIFLPHASPRNDATTKHTSWMRHLPARAFDNSVFVVACNQWGSNGKGLKFAGNAVILDPSGNILKKRLSDKAGMLTATLKAADLESVRSHPMRHFFPNRRPELY